MLDSPQKTILRIDPDVLLLEPLDLDPGDFQSPLPVQHNHLIFEDPAIGMAVGVWDTTTMQEAFEPYPGDEFVTVLDGSFAILDATGHAVTGAAGQSATFHNAVPVSWKQDGYLRKIYLTLQPGDAAPVPADGPVTQCVRVLDPATPVQTGANADGVAREVVFRNLSGTMTVTQSTYPSMILSATASAGHELCRVMAGEMAIADTAGRVQRFFAGDHFLLPRGTTIARRTSAGTTALHVVVTA